MISQTAEYCLRAVICLAAAPGKPQTTQQIADSTKIPVGYLAKVLQSLGRARIVTAQRGLNGGFVLDRDPATLSLLEVVRVVDPSRRVSACPLGIHGNSLCPLHRQLDEAAGTVERILSNRTIADLSAGTNGVSSPLPLCATTFGDSSCLK